MIVLASKSPRRRSLMNRITNDFLTYDSNIDESLSLVKENPIEITKDISLRKAIKAKETYKDDIILSADTIVVLNNRIIGKPKDEDDAFKILKDLSNNTHEVITAYTLINKDKIITNTVISKVTFYELSDEFIKEYIKTGSPMDKAGGYGIQDKEGNQIVKSYEGSYDNIVGFPVDEIRKDLENIKK